MPKVEVVPPVGWVSLVLVFDLVLSFLYWSFVAFSYRDQGVKGCPLVYRLKTVRDRTSVFYCVYMGT